MRPADQRLSSARAAVAMLVAPGALRRLADGVSIRFLVPDGQASVPVRFAGIVPSLFRGGSGVVADGRFLPDRPFAADRILAAHDERYRRPAVAGALRRGAGPR